MNFVRQFLQASLLLLLAACTGSVENVAIPASPEVIVSQQRFTTTYVLNPGDVLEVIVERTPDLSRVVTVRPDGVVTIPEAGDVKVAGVSTATASARIEAALSKRLLDPEVTIIVQNPPVPSVFIAGEVGRSASIPVREARTAAEAVVLAGGLQRTAALDQVALIRLYDDGYLRATVIPNVSDDQAGIMLALSAITLRSGDILYVPESGRSQFTRGLQDFVTLPLSALNAIIAPYVQLELLRELNNTP